MDGDERPERVADAFGALANPLRVRILLALADTRRPDWDHRGMSYSELRTAVGVEDGGRFNYHLGELRDRFVVCEDGHYWLTTAGIRVVDEVFAGTFGDSRARSGTLSDDCPRCGAALTAEVEDSVLTASCPTHGVFFDMPLAPRAPAGRDLDELYRWAHRRALWYIESVSWDVCPHCAGRFGEATVEPAPASDAAGDRGGSPAREHVVVGHTCRRCGISFRLDALGYALAKPVTVAFFADHGLDTWSDLTLDPAVRRSYGAELRDDRIHVRFELDGDLLELELDRELSVRSVRRDAVE